MQALVRQISEILFTSYLLPALLLPIIWLAGAAARRGRVPTEPERSLARVFTVHAVVATTLVTAWGLGALGVPLERGGAPLTIAAWLLFATLQFAFAALASGVTSRYAAIPEGRARDALFVKFVALTLLQPIATAAALHVLYRLMRLVYHHSLPLFDTLPEGL